MDFYCSHCGARHDLALLHEGERVVPLSPEDINRMATVLARGIRDQLNDE